MLDSVLHDRFGPYSLTTLTGVLKGPQSELKTYLTTRYANTLPARKLFEARSGDLVVRDGDAPAGTVGTAFDVMVRLLLDPEHHPADVDISQWWKPVHQTTADQALDRAKAALAAGDGKTFDAASWMLAQLIETTRNFNAWAGSPLNEALHVGTFDFEAWLDTTPPDALRQLSELRALAAERLLPQLRHPLALNQRLSTWDLLRAEVDIIAAGTLVDLKTNLGAKLRSGERRDALPAQSLLQVIGYVLLDEDDEFAIRCVGVYSARYGNFASWPVEELMSTLAQEPVTLREERQRLLAIL